MNFTLISSSLRLSPKWVEPPPLPLPSSPLPVLSHFSTYNPARQLEEDLSWTVVQEYILFFIPIWRIWLDTHNYLNRYDQNDMTTKILMLVQMILIMGAGSAFLNGFDQTRDLFLVCLLLSRLIFVVLYLVYALFFLPNFRLLPIPRNLEILTPCFKESLGQNQPHSRASIFLTIALTVFPSLFWLPAFGLTGTSLRALIWTADIIDLLTPFLLVPLFRTFFHPRFVVALNVEQ